MRGKESGGVRERARKKERKEREKRRERWREREREKERRKAREREITVELVLLFGGSSYNTSLTDKNNINHPYACY